MFRGTLRYQTFLATLELVSHICSLAALLSDADFEKMSWTDTIQRKNKEIAHTTPIHPDARGCSYLFYLYNIYLFLRSGHDFQPFLQLSNFYNLFTRFSANFLSKLPLHACPWSRYRSDRPSSPAQFFPIDFLQTQKVLHSKRKSPQHYCCGLDWRRWRDLNSRAG